LEYKLHVFVVKFEAKNALTVEKNFYCSELGILGEHERELILSPLIRLI
jgi:hypothetical protein